MSVTEHKEPIPDGYERLSELDPATLARVVSALPDTMSVKAVAEVVINVILASGAQDHFIEIMAMTFTAISEQDGIVAVATPLSEIKGAKDN